MKQYIPCAKCERRSLIANVTLYQTHWYTPPSGCTDGDYWNEGECQFVCHHCNTVNRLLHKSTYDDAKHQYVSAAHDIFRWQYRKTFKEVIDTHDDNALIPKFDIVALALYKQRHGKLPTQNWVNNNWIDSLKD